MTSAERPGGRDDIDAQFADIVAGFDRVWDEQRPSPPVPPTPPPAPALGTPVRETGLDPADFEQLRFLDSRVFGPGSVSGAQLDEAADDLADERTADQPQTERAWRREQRRLERIAELEAFNSEKQRLAAEYTDDPEGWTPPPPPPVPKPHRRTVVALLLMVLGGLLMLRPGWFAVHPDISLVLGLLGVVGGVALLVNGLRRQRHTDPIPDDGAEL